MLTVLLAGAFLFWISCDSSSDVKLENESELHEAIDVSATGLGVGEYEVGSFAGGLITITVDSSGLEDVFVDFVEDSLGLTSASLDSFKIIDDDVTSGDTANLAWYGIAYDGGDQVKILVGHQLVKHHDVDLYAVGGPGGKVAWKCEAENCQGCQPDRNFLGVVTGCDFTGGPVDENESSGCNHSRAGGGNGGAIIGALSTLLIYWLGTQ